MNHTDSRQTLLAINSTEWLNLCARGSIRMSKRRPVAVPIDSSARDLEKVFATAPFTKISSSVDLFVLLIDNDWAKNKRGHRSFSSEILHLNLTDVIQHYPVALEHYEYYKTIGFKCGIHLAKPIFEKAWQYWIINETISASSDAAAILQHTFQIPSCSGTKRSDKYTWEEIARIVLRPSESIKARPAHAETLLRSIRRIADAVSTTRDSEQFYLACAIEWTNIRLNKDPLKNKSTKDALLEALSTAKERPLGAPSELTSTALKLLAETFPKAFTEELSPMAVAQVVQVLTESRTRKLKAETIIRIIHSNDRASPSSTFITFVLATSLGVELTHQLVIAMGHGNLVEMTWEIPN